VVQWPTPIARNYKWRTLRWPGIHATPFTFQPEILPRLQSESCSCIEATLCPEFLEMLALRPAQSEDLRRITCGFKGFCPLVCCNQVSIHRHVDADYFPTSGTYPQSNCKPITTVEPRINLRTTPYHAPGVYYPTTVRYLNSGSRRKPYEETSEPINSDNIRFNQGTQFDPHGNSFVTQSSSVQDVQNVNSKPNLMSKFPVTPDYFVRTQYVPNYNGEDSQHYPDNITELYPHISHPISKPNYPNRSVPLSQWSTETPHDSFESDRHGYSTKEYFSSHQTGMHSSNNPSESGKDHFQYHRHPSHGYSNRPVYQQQPNHHETPDYGHVPERDFSYPFDSHAGQYPSDGAHQDGSGFQSNLHNYHNHDQHFQPKNRPFQPPGFYPSDTHPAPTSPEMKNGPGDSDNDTVGTPWKRRLLPTDGCGMPLGERIVGGKNAALGAYPWIARIGYTRE
jgi:hypothetical protein